MTKNMSNSHKISLHGILVW